MYISGSGGSCIPYSWCRSPLIARLAEAFGVRTGWHGPGNIDLINHAAQGHVDLTIPNFGIQEDVDLGLGEGNSGGLSRLPADEEGIYVPQRGTRDWR